MPKEKRRGWQRTEILGPDSQKVRLRRRGNTPQCRAPGGLRHPSRLQKRITQWVRCEAAQTTSVYGNDKGQLLEFTEDWPMSFQLSRQREQKSGRFAFRADRFLKESGVDKWFVDAMDGLGLLRCTAQCYCSRRCRREGSGGW